MILSPIRRLGAHQEAEDKRWSYPLVPQPYTLNKTRAWRSIKGQDEHNDPCGYTGRNSEIG